MVRLFNEWDNGARSMLFDGLWRHESVFEIHESAISFGHPKILWPIMSYANGSILVELETDAHPGGRCFASWPEDGDGNLWAFDVAGLIDLVADAAIAGGVETHGNFASFDGGVLHRLVDERVGSLPGLADRHFDIYDRPAWPSHWLEFEGEGAERWQLRGATHTVDEFDLAREAGPTTGTVIATFRTALGGGYGDFGRVSDASGWMNAFIPVELFRRVNFVSQRLCELDLIGFPEFGDGPGSIGPIVCDLMRAHYPEYDADAAGEAFERMFAQERRLDRSVLIVDARPVD
ncbi:MAG: hypothetical protein AAGA90_03835 [Actinomycetota bacterium]